jgi:hypothetical protein
LYQFVAAAESVCQGRDAVQLVEDDHGPDRNHQGDTGAAVVEAGCHELALQFS